MFKVLVENDTKTIRKPLFFGLHLLTTKARLTCTVIELEIFLNHMKQIDYDSEIVLIYFQSVCHEILNTNF